MQINLANAIKKFYPNPVLEQVYFEAIANSIYANATEINLDISIESYSKPETLKMTISDNGDGFNDNNYHKFGRLLETDDEDHKGLGRLVFLNYFKKVSISSIYQNNERLFEYSQSFEKNKSTVNDAKNKSNKTILKFSQYSKKEVYKYDYLKPISVKKALELHFFSTFPSIQKKRERFKNNN